MEEESGTLEVEDAGADSSDSPAEVRIEGVCFYMKIGINIFFSG